MLILSQLILGYSFLKFTSITFIHIFFGFRSSRPEVYLGKTVLRICSKFAGEHPCWSAISIKLLCNFIEITRWNGCSQVNMLDILRTPFLKNTSGWLLLWFLLVRAHDSHTVQGSSIQSHKLVPWLIQPFICLCWKNVCMKILETLYLKVVCLLKWLCSNEAVEHYP